MKLLAQLFYESILSSSMGWKRKKWKFRLDNVNKEPAREMRRNDKKDEKNSGLTLKIPKEVSCFPKGKIQFVKK